MDPGSVIVLLIRLLVPVSILRFPVAGFFACVALDGLHAPIVYGLNLRAFSFAGDVASYHLLDKWLDMYFLAFAVRASQKWQDELNSRAMLWMWILRLAGVIVFSTTGARFALFIFPNLLVAYYPFVACARRWVPRLVPRTGVQLLVVLCVMLIPKLILEYWLHVEMLGLGEALSRHTRLQIPAATLWQWIIPGS